MSVVLRNVIDGLTGQLDLDSEPVDLLIEVDSPPCVLPDATDQSATDTFDGRGAIALPGFTDLYARLREPGPSRRGTLTSETRAALHAGFTRVCCAPDTEPAIDSTATVELVLRHAAAAAGARVLPIAAMTVALDCTHLAELATLKAAGCIGVGHADVPLADTRLLYDAMRYAASFDLPLIMTPRDSVLGASGCAHDGAVATRLGLPAIPVAAESIALARLLELVHETGARLHVSRLSSARAVEMIGNAKRAGLPVTADVGIAHLWFTEEDLDGFDARYASAVPFRSIADREALRSGLADGTIDAICSDHAPLDADASLAPFQQVEPGLSTYDRFVPMLLGLASNNSCIRDSNSNNTGNSTSNSTGNSTSNSTIRGTSNGKLPLARLIEAVTAGPDSVLELPASTDVVLIDRTAAVDTGQWLSAGRNSPWLETDGLTGIVHGVIMDGSVVVDAFPDYLRRSGLMP